MSLLEAVVFGESLVRQGRAFATRFPAEKAGRAQTMAQSLMQKEKQ